MPDINLLPLAGINNAADDESLFVGGESPRLFVRDAKNVDISKSGRVDLMGGSRLLLEQPLKNIWQSPIHKDVFGRVGDKLVRVVTTEGPQWKTEELATIGSGDLSFCLLNNLVCVAGDNGIYTYNGQEAQRLTIDTPPAPFLTGLKAGSMANNYLGLAVSWLKGSTEGPLSAVAMKDEGDGSVQVTMPLCMDDSITSVRLYATTHSGGVLYRYATYDISETQVTIPYVNNVGEEAKFKNLSPMPTGQNLSYWKGRLITSRGNTLRFSEAMAYHLHDERHGFIQFPQRITFLIPVEGGIWVGQVDHVIFVRGASLEELTIEHKKSQPPIQNSAMLVDASVVGAELSQGGEACALWLGANGYVIGTSAGQVVELHQGVMKDIAANNGNSVVLAGRAYTTLT